MTWIESHQELGSHPKTIKLARVLDISKAQVVGHLHYLWWWSMDYAQDGDLSKFDALDIAIGSEWEGDPVVWLQALHQVGFIDRPNGDDVSVIHDWHDYAGKLIERRERNADRMREARAGTKDERATHVQRTQDARAGLPNRTVPNPTEPNQTVGEESPKTPPRARTASSSGFDTFWGNYPNKVARQDAEKAWIKLGPSADLQAEINAAVDRQKGWESWQAGYIPHPATFLNGKRWLDEEPPRKQAASNGRASPGDEVSSFDRVRIKHGLPPKGQAQHDNIIDAKGALIS